MFRMIKRKTVLGYISSEEMGFRYLGYEIIIGGKVQFSKKEIALIEKCLIEKKETGEFNDSKEYMKITEALGSIQKLRDL